MYRIIGQPINLRYIATSNIVKSELSEKALQITKIAEFSLRYGYTASQSIHTMCVRQSGIIRS